jgi:hypothetical protein
MARLVPAGHRFEPFRLVLRAAAFIGHRDKPGGDDV